MKNSSLSSFIILALSIISTTHAFPQFVPDLTHDLGTYAATQQNHNSSLLGTGIPSSINLAPLISIGRKVIPDAAHPFMEPGPGDARGLCPGLNIMANHGYIPRNGITDMTQLIYGLEEGLGLAPDLAAVLIAFSLKTSVDLTTLKMSIGDTDSRTDGPLTGLLGRAPGLFSPEAHNKYEIDGSLAGDDAYFANGQTTRFNGTRWARWRNIAVEKYGGVMSIPWNAEVRSIQYKECRDINPRCQWSLVDEFAFYCAQQLINTLMPSAEADGKPGLAYVDAIDTFFGYHPNEQGEYVQKGTRFPPGSEGVYYRRTVPHTPIFGSNEGQLGHWNSDVTQIQHIADINLACILINRASSVDDTRYDGVAKEGLQTLLDSVLGSVRQQVGC